MPLTKEREFRVILSLSEDDGDCTVRFHQIRPGETSSSDNLKDYESEALLIFDVLTYRVAGQ